MRHSLYAAVALAAMTTGSLVSGQAQAFGLPGTPGAANTIEKVAYRTVCERVWDGYQYVRQCRQVYYEPAPRYYEPAPRYYAPAPRYYGGGGGYGY